MTALLIQKNFDGQGVDLKLNDIFVIEPKCKMLFNQCVAIGLDKPLKNNDGEFMRIIKPRLVKLVGYDAEKEVLSASDTYELYYKACLEAVNCWDYYRPIKDKRWGYGAFKKKFGVAPRFNSRDIGGDL
ncbi:MAG: hypothetical protein PHV05_04635 [Candidatus Riflebacteria bacterium]|nr:hypothetical protein [Candidatus Riflebacteria bacterium]